MIHPWEINKMLEARQHFEQRGETMLDAILSRPQRVKRGLVNLAGSALSLILLGWVLGRKGTDTQGYM